MKLALVVDRIEGAMAVLASPDLTFDWPLALLPPDIAEGAVLHFTIERDPETEGVKRDELAARLARLTGGDPGGDFSL